MNESDIPNHFEASGVILRPDGHMMYIVFDNTFQIGAFCTPLAVRTLNCTNKLLDWPNKTLNKVKSEFEDIAYNPMTDTYFIIQETIPSSLHPDEFNSNIFQIQITPENPMLPINIIESCYVSWTFDSSNKGFEGIQFITHHKTGKNYLLALCEANKCTMHSMFKELITNLGNGRLAVLERHKNSIKGKSTMIICRQTFLILSDPCQWLPVGIINLPSSVRFLDYSAVSTYSTKASTYIAITSQENSQVWIGIIEEIDQRPYFRITSTEQTSVYNLPRAIVNDSFCEKQYCNLEGVAWINEHEFILVSDQAKATHAPICSNKGESIHHFLIPIVNGSLRLHISNYLKLLIFFNLYSFFPFYIL